MLFEWLSKGAGSIENTVALCPNCHKKMHIVQDAADIQEAEMKFTKNELIMINRHAAGNRDETVERLRNALSVTGDALDRAFMYNAAEKLERTAEPECCCCPFILTSNKSD